MSEARPRFARTARVLACLVGALFGVVLGGISSLALLLFGSSGPRLYVPPAVGLLVGPFGGDRGLYLLMRIVGKL